MKRRYFPIVENGPSPLSLTVERVVRFEEVDPMRIVWHGRYPSYFEDARVAFGRRFGVGYLDFMEHGTPAPIKRLGLDYVLPLRFEEPFSIEAILHWSDAARINFEFIIRNADKKVATTGYSVQLMLDRNYNLLLEPPPFYQAFMDKWRAGEMPDDICLDH